MPGHRDETVVTLAKVIEVGAVAHALLGVADSQIGMALQGLDPAPVALAAEDSRQHLQES